MTTGKTIALTGRTFVGKVMSLLLNMLSRLVITFLPRSKRLLISWLQSPSVVILEPRPGIKPALGVRKPSHSTSRKVPEILFFYGTLSELFLSFFFKKINLFIFSCPWSLLLRVGFSLQWLLLLREL